MRRPKRARPTGGEAGGEAGPEPAGVLIARAWLEGPNHDRLRVRLIARTQLNGPEQVDVTDSAEQAALVLRLWLAAFSAGRPAH